MTRFFNIETRREFLNFWTTLFKVERAVEVLREKMARRTHFSLRDAFDHLDGDRDGYVHPTDLRDVLAEAGFYATEREL